MKYEIGQNVWRATFEPHETSVECPDCCGEGRLRVIMGDDSIVSIECEGCCRGYNAPDGRIKCFDRTPAAYCEIILGVEVREGKTEWQTTGAYRASEDDLFDTEYAALERAKTIAADWDASERARIQQKEKPLKSWSWHAHYHRREIREAQRRIAYHTAKLNVAKIKAKERATPPSDTGAG